MTLYLDSNYKGDVPDTGLATVSRITELKPELVIALARSEADLRVIDAESFTADVGTPEQDVRIAALRVMLAAAEVRRDVAVYGAVPGGYNYAPRWSRHYQPIFDQIKLLKGFGFYKGFAAVSADAYYRWGDEEFDTESWTNLLANQVEAARAIGLPFYLYVSPMMINQRDADGRPRFLPMRVWERHLRAVRRYTSVDGVIYFGGYDNVIGPLPWSGEDENAVGVMTRVLS